MREWTRSALDRVIINQELLEMLKDQGNIPASNLAVFEEKIVEYKREYRKRLRLEDKEGESFRGTNGKVVGCGGEYDHSWVKVFFEGETWSREEMKEFSDYIWIHYTPSQYDCTGQWFTWAVDCFNTPRGVVVYVREAMDV